MSVSKREGIRMAENAQLSYKAQAQSYEEELKELDGLIEQANSQLDDAIAQLSTGLISNLDPGQLRGLAEEVGPLHLEDRLNSLKEQCEGYQTRAEAIAADPGYIDRDNLIHPRTGQYTEELREATELWQGISQQKEAYEFDQFLWLLKRGFHEERQHGHFKSFWRAITLADFRERRAWEAVQERLGVDDFRAAAGHYGELCEHHEFLVGQRDEAQARFDRIVGLVKEHDELRSWVGRFPEIALETLRRDLAGFLKGCNFEELHRHIREAGRIHVAKCQALAKKQEYYADMQKYLRGGVADREQRIKAIERVAQKWRRKPSGYLRGNKTKWLVELPAIKQAATAKRRQWVHTMSHNIHGYQNYHHYHSLLLAAVPFLAYDAFALAGEMRMPYEGFSGGVIKEIFGYRQEHHELGPNYASLRQTLSDSQDEWEGFEDWDGSYDESAYEDEAMESEAEVWDSESDAEMDDVS